MSTNINTVLEFARLEPHAAADVAEMINVCSSEELAYLEKVARSVLGGVIAALSERNLLAAVRRLPEDCSVTTVEQLVERLEKEGGSIVGAHECSEFEIAAACIEHRYAVSTENFGFVLRPQRWLDANKPKDGGGNVVFLKTYRRNGVL